MKSPEGSIHTSRTFSITSALNLEPNIHTSTNAKRERFL
jgi:hypothetical protein